MTTHTSGAADLLMNTEAGRKYVADFFISIGRHDFADYIAHELAGDFACVLAHALAAGQAVAPVVDNKTAGHAMLWRQHCDKLDALVTYCPTCCQGFIAQKEMTRDQIIYECGKTAGRAALPAPAAMDGGEDAARLLRQILAASQDGDSDTRLSAHFVSRIEKITKTGGMG